MEYEIGCNLETRYATCKGHATPIKFCQHKFPRLGEKFCTKLSLKTFHTCCYAYVGDLKAGGEKMKEKKVLEGIILIEDIRILRAKLELNILTLKDLSNLLVDFYDIAAKLKFTTVAEEVDRLQIRLNWATTQQIDEHLERIGEMLEKEYNILPRAGITG